MSTGLLIIIIFVGVLLVLIGLVLFIRVRFTLEYQENLEMGLYIGPFKLKHAFDSKEDKARREGAEPPSEKLEEETGRTGKLIKTVKLIIKILRHLKGHVTINFLQLYCTVGSHDPMQAALLYGGGWAVLGNIVGLLDKEFIIKHQDCQMFCRYEDMETEFYIKLQLYTRVWEVLRAGKLDFVIGNEKRGSASPQAAAGGDN